MLKRKKEFAQKKVIKQDDLITTYENALAWYQTNKKLVTNIGIVLVVVIAGGWFYLNNQRQNNEKAALDFAKVFTYYDNGQYQTAINGIPEKSVRGLKDIVANYGSTEYGNLARLYLANSEYGLGQYSEALEAYKEADLSSPLLEASRISGIAACQEALGNYAEAAREFEKAGKYSENDPNAPDNLANAARNFARAGDKEHAIELYEFIKKEHAGSTAARDAERLLEELRG